MPADTRSSLHSLSEDPSVSLAVVNVTVVAEVDVVDTSLADDADGSFSAGNGPSGSLPWV